MVHRIPNQQLASLMGDGAKAASAAEGSPMRGRIDPLPVTVRFDFSIEAGTRTIPASPFLWVSPARSDRSVRALEVLLLLN